MAKAAAHHGVAFQLAAGHFSHFLLSSITFESVFEIDEVPPPPPPSPPPTPLPPPPPTPRKKPKQKKPKPPAPHNAASPLAAATPATAATSSPFFDASATADAPITQTGQRNANANRGSPNDSNHNFSPTGAALLVYHPTLVLIVLIGVAGLILKARRGGQQ